MPAADIPQQNSTELQGFVHPDNTGDVNTETLNNVLFVRLLAKRIKDCHQWDMKQSNGSQNWAEKPVDGSHAIDVHA